MIQTEAGVPARRGEVRPAIQVGLASDRDDDEGSGHAGADRLVSASPRQVSRASSSAAPLEIDPSARSGAGVSKERLSGGALPSPGSASEAAHESKTAVPKLSR